MKNKLLHTPDGVRDIYNEECEKKLILQEKLQGVLKLYGYRSIQTPTFEFFDIFSSERGTIPSKDMYKFFDRDGETLVLRPDFTPSIARSAAKYYVDEDMPIRLCYMGNTFINNSSYQGRLKETTQLGAELIGDDTVSADAEMIALVVDILKKSGLTEFQVEIGQVDFFKGLLEEAGIGEETEETLRELISKKNFFGVEELVSEQNISDELKNTFLKLPELFGSIDKLEEARTLTSNERALRAIDRLEELYEVLKDYGMDKYISFDLGMLSKYKYYTGIILRAYTYGTGEPLVTGGRYDNLLKQFGKNAASIGFAVVIDQLMLALSGQKIAIPVEHSNTLILYKKPEQKLAIQLTNHFRSTGVNIELILMDEKKTLDDYKAFAKRNYLGGILYLEGDDGIQVINSETGSVQSAALSDFMKGM